MRNTFNIISGQLSRAVPPPKRLRASRSQYRAYLRDQFLRYVLAQHAGQTDKPVTVRR